MNCGRAQAARRAQVKANLTLRAPDAADMEALAKFGRDSFVSKFGHIYQAEDLDQFLEATHSPRAVAAEWANPDRLYRLAEIDGRLVGYCKLGLGCAWPEHARADRVIELKQLYSDPAMTGQGIGTALMAWALDAARQLGAGEIQLSVWSGNPGAQRFYARYGFEKLADIAFWVGRHRDDEFLFALRL